jgi:N4-gp56 family major capsid protein
MATRVATLATDVPAPVNFVLMKGLLQAARKKLPYFNGTLPGQLDKNGGSASVKWERINNLTANTTALGEFQGNAAYLYGRALVTPTVSNVTVAMAKYGQAIQLTEEIDIYNVNTRAMKFMDTLGANAGESLNALMFAVYQGATNIRYCNNAAGGAASLSNVAFTVALTDIKYAVNTLNNNAAMPYTPLGTGSVNIGTLPIRSSYYGICHVDVEEDIRGLTGFVAVEQYAGYTETMPFEFGAVGGVRWASTQVSTIASQAGKKTATGMRGGSQILNDVYDSFIYGKEAIGTVGLGNMHAANSYEMYNPKAPPAVELIYKNLGSAGAGDPFNEIASLAWKAFFAGKILNANWVVKLRSTSAKV